MQSSVIPIAILLVLSPSLVPIRGATPSDVAEQPNHLNATARIAQKNEPGTPLVIAGRVVGPDGRTAIAGAIVYAYHTDAEGNYGRRGQGGEADEDHPRLRGWVKTDTQGQFEFATIKPAAYPHRNVPAHVHIHAWSTQYPRQWFMLEFKDDPSLPKQHFTDNTADYLYIEPLTREKDGILHCSVTLKLNTKSNFP